MNAKERVTDIVIVGGGTAGWMTAAMMAKLLARGYRIRLVESEEIGTIGVGEATIPSIKVFNAALGLDEDELLRATQGTFKLGIEFVDWWRCGHSYIHGFGRIGQDWGILKCYQYWLRQHLAGSAPALGRYSINTVAPPRMKFMRSQPQMKDSPLADIAYALHFDAGLYAAFLRRFSEQRGVIRTEGTVVRVAVDATSGHITAIEIASGERITGDLFIDCTGMRALLIGQTLGVGFEDWSRWLPCDRAVAVPSATDGKPIPMTRSIARPAGWQWRIPLQHRIGNGLVYSSHYLEDDAAEAQLLANLDGPATAAPRRVRFTAGKRRQMWSGNCVAVGLSSGFLEPLESTSIHLIQAGVVRLMRLFPHRGVNAAETSEYNRRCDFDYERIRDFLILHYHATQRDDSPLWQYCRTMSIPATLEEKLALFRENGRIFREGEELFAEESWLHVLFGQGILPHRYDPIVDQQQPDDITRFLKDIERVIDRCVQVMPTHADFIAEHCRAGSL